MLSSARQGARRAPRFASTLVPQLAESSRQAQVRAMGPAASAKADPGRRGLAAAVMLAAADGSSAAGDAASPLNPAAAAAAAAAAAGAGSAITPKARRDPSSPRHGANRESRDFKSPQPSSRGVIIPVDAPLTAGERFSRQVKADTVQALRDLGTMSREDLRTVDIKDIRHLLYWAQQDVSAAAHLHNVISREEATVSLKVIRAFLFAQPTRRPGEAFLGRSMQGRSLRALLRLAVNLGCKQLVAETFTERLDEQLRLGRQIIDLDGLTMDLAVAKQWSLMVGLLPGPSSRLPTEVWTPNMVANVMRANVATNKPQAAIDLFNELQLPSPTPESLCVLIQAYLEIGDIPAAQQAARAAYSADVAYRDIQLAILRGYRTLGHDEHVEERVRRGFAQLEIPLEAPILNAFIRLRLESGDVSGAEDVLNEFRLFGRSTGVEPNVSSAVAALMIFMSKQDPGHLDVKACAGLWNAMVQTDVALVTDTTVTHLCRALERFGLSDDVYSIFEAAVRGGKARWTLRWNLPINYRPGILLANTAMDVCLRSQGYDGLVKVGQLMSEGDIDPDERTVERVLEFASNNLLASPTSLARLLRELNARTDTPPTADQVNVIVAEALRVGLRNPESVTRWVGPRTPTTGEHATPDSHRLELRGELRALLEKRVPFLKKTKNTTGRQLRTRLMYDALALGDEPAERSIRATWQAFVLRGYRPGAKHYLSLLRAYVQIGALADAEEVIRIAASEGVVPTQAMFAGLISGCGAHGQLKRARAWYEEARRVPGGPDAAALVSVLKAHTLNGDPRTAVAIARQDFQKVHMDESVVAAVAHALRLDHDVPGAIFFIEHHAWLQTGSKRADAGADSDAVPTPQPVPPNVEYILTPRLRNVVRKMLNYLGKQPLEALDQRSRIAYATAQQMVNDDTAARPKPMRCPPRLGEKHRHLIADTIARAAARDGVSGLDLERASAEAAAEDTITIKDGKPPSP